MSAKQDSVAERPAARSPRFEVALTLAVLTAVAAVIGAMWWRIAPPAGQGVERYLPFNSGDSFRYRITQPDGSATDAATNIERLPGRAVLPLLDLTALSGLFKALGIPIADADMRVLFGRIADQTFVRESDTYYDQKGAATTTGSIMIVSPRQIKVLSQGALIYDPPYPVLDDQLAIGTTEVVSGTVSTADRSGHYSASLTLEAIESVDTAIGRWPDCMRVRLSFAIGTARTESRTWYCSGLGATKAESGVDPKITRYDLISAATLATTPRAIENITDAPADLSLSSLPSKRVFPEAVINQSAPAWTYKDERLNGNISTPSVSLGSLLLYGSLNGGLLALDRTTRLPQWRFQTGGAIHGAPAAADAVVYVTSDDRKLYALDASSGAFRWAFAARDAISTSPVFSSGTVYFGSDDRNIYAIDARSGQLRWSHRTGGAVSSTPLVAGNRVFAGSDDGAIYALDRATGELRWAYATGDAISASPVISGGILYIGSYDGKVYALKAGTDAQSGELVWAHNVRSQLGSAVSVQGGVVYLSAASDVLALDASTGAERWRYHSTQLYGTPLLVGEQLIVNRANDLLTLDAVTGARRAVVATDTSAAYADIGSDGRQLFVGHWNGLMQVYGENP